MRAGAAPHPQAKEARRLAPAILAAHACSWSNLPSQIVGTAGLTFKHKAKAIDVQRNECGKRFDDPHLLCPEHHGLGGDCLQHDGKHKAPERMRRAGRSFDKVQCHVRAAP